MAMKVQTRPELKLGTPRRLFSWDPPWMLGILQLDITADAERFLLVAPGGGGGGGGRIAQRGDAGRELAGRVPCEHFRLGYGIEVGVCNCTDRINCTAAALKPQCETSTVRPRGREGQLASRYNQLLFGLDRVSGHHGNPGWWREAGH
jgi:hypothetical protein